MGNESRCSVTVLLVLALVTTGAAQVPDGWFVVSSFRSTVLPNPVNPWPGLGGLYFVHPRDPTVAATTVTGLDVSLTGSVGLPTYHGANCVVRRPRDGALVVGEIVPLGTPSVRIHVITLNGSQVASDVPYPIGSASGATATPYGSIDQLALLPNDTILFALRGITTATLGAASLAILDPSTGLLTPVNVGPALNGVINAVTTDAPGTTAYFARFSTTAISSTIHRVTLPGGTATLVATVSGVVSYLAVDNAGQLLATTFGTDNNGAPPSLFRIDPATGAITPIPTPAFGRNAIAIERATGNYAIEREAYANPTMAISWMTPSGAETVLSSGPPGGWGVITGIDVNNDPEAFGPPTSPGARTYRWAVAPNPGGLPQRGNAQFSLTLVSTPSGSPGFWGASLAPLSPPSSVSGILLNIDPTQLLVLGPLLGQTQETIPLPLPNIASLAGAVVYLQSVHFDTAGGAASTGLVVTIL